LPQYLVEVGVHVVLLVKFEDIGLEGLCCRFAKWMSAAEEVGHVLRYSLARWTKFIFGCAGHLGSRLEWKPSMGELLYNLSF